MVEAAERKSRIFRLLAIMMMLALPGISSAQVPAPRITCASTDNSGLVTLNWQIDNQPVIDKYKIYWSRSSTGPYTSVTFPNDGSLTRQISAVDGRSQRYFFSMRSFSAGDSSASSAVVSNIWLSMENSPPPNNGIALLTWNAFDVSTPGIYTIVRTDPAGKRKTFNVSGLSFRDTISSPYCGPTNLTYQVQNAGSCVSNSNSTTGVFQDNTQPVDVVMDSISIDSNGNTILSWFPSVSADVEGYRIDQGSEYLGFHPLDFVQGRNTTSFTSNVINACETSRSFAVIPRDSCSILSSSTAAYQNALNTIKLGKPIGNECKGTVMLTWNSYNNMKPALGGYQVFRREGTKPFTLVGKTNPGVTTFTDATGFSIGVSYTYFVRAISQDGHKSSSSCRIPFIYNGQLKPDTLLISYASVTDKQTIKISIHYAPFETVKSLQILRSETANGPFDTIGVISRGIHGDTVFEDKTADVNRKSYYYRTNALDECDKYLLGSQPAHTMFLVCHTNSDESHTLSWNAYSGWTNGVGHYGIYRLVNNVADPANPIGSTSDTTFTDLLPASQGEDIISYYIIALERNVEKPHQSTSNTVQAIRQPQVLMPNAFIPRGTKNNRFRPVMDYFVDERGYQLVIYNKWWQQVFVSEDKMIGWDGKFNGEYAPGGVYYYALRYRSLTGGSYTKTGLLLLLE